MKGTTKRAKFNRAVLAYTFGRISPKSKSTPVMASISTTKVNSGLQSSGEKKVLSKNVDRITIPTFTKLLDIKMVPSNSSGFTSNVLILLCFGVSSSSSSSSPAPNEKNATSEPEIKADKRRRIMSTTMKATPVIEASMVKNCRIVLGGSVSNLW